MNRDDIRDQVLNAPSTSILCELPTGVGKSKIALDYMSNKLAATSSLNLLIVVPRLVLIENWKEEFKKWGYEKYLPYTEFVTYVSFPKKVGVYDMIIFDEAHHFSERCRGAFEDFITGYTLLLSATVGRNMRYELKGIFKEKSDIPCKHITGSMAQVAQEIYKNLKPNDIVIGLGAGTITKLGSELLNLSTTKV